MLELLCFRSLAILYLLYLHTFIRITFLQFTLTCIYVPIQCIFEIHVHISPENIFSSHISLNLLFNFFHRKKQGRRIKQSRIISGLGNFGIKMYLLLCFCCFYWFTFFDGFCNKIHILNVASLELANECGLPNVHHK